VTNLSLAERYARDFQFLLDCGASSESLKSLTKCYDALVKAEAKRNRKKNKQK